jgi:YegS/Rv2252/BmrU family lipid kinase
MAIVNPASANGTTGKVWPALSKRLTAAGLEHDARVTSRRGEASDLTRSALADGYRTIVAVGGDGTLNEVANGFFDGDRRLGQGARLGLISRGTGCDFIRTVGVPKEEEAAIEVLRTGHTRRVDVGRAVFTGHDGREAVRYFVNIAGLGLDGETVDRVNRTTKALGGFFSFLWGTLATIATYRNKDIEIVIDGGRPVKERMTLVVVANGQYFGGGMRIAPEAAVDDGLFDICTLGDCSRPELVGSLRKVYKGAHTTHPKIRFYRGKEVTVRSPDRVLLDIDGEQPGLADVTFTVLPGVLDVIVQRAGA